MSRQNLKNKSEKKREKLLNKQPKAKHQRDKLKKHAKKSKSNKSSYGVSFAYQLYMYRQELRRPSSEFSYLRRSRAKIVLTAQLIAQNIGQFNNLCSVDDLKMLSREVQFKKRLCNQVQRLEQFRELGLTEMVLNGKKTPL